MNEHFYENEIAIPLQAPVLLESTFISNYIPHFNLFRL
jgi:hypothetical protein